MANEEIYLTHPRETAPQPTRYEPLALDFSPIREDDEDVSETNEVIEQNGNSLEGSVHISSSGVRPISHDSTKNINGREKCVSKDDDMESISKVCWSAFVLMHPC